MTEYGKTKWNITNKVIEIASDIQKQEKAMDMIYKVNIYLMREYGKEVLEKFKDRADIKKYCENVLINIQNNKLKDMLLTEMLFKEIAADMNKEMPEPWYVYGFGSNE